MDQRPPAYYQWTQFDEFCSCSLRKGVYQREYEEVLNKYLQEGNSVSDSRIEAIKNLSHLKLCCLRDLTLPPSNFICCSTTNALTDITINRGTAIQKNVRKGNDMNHVGWEFLPLTKGHIGFNMNNYCTKISQVSQPSFDKIGLNGNRSVSVEKLPPKFSNFFISRSQDYPLDEPSIPFPTDEELLSCAKMAQK
uniref:Uncharacterized protein n=1 Tax=viral metagenome TaxID=1070528 RepID=A0A6C0BD84_9ZZZZ